MLSQKVTFSEPLSQLYLFEKRAQNRPKLTLEVKFRCIACSISAIRERGSENRLKLRREIKFFGNPCSFRTIRERVPKST